MQRLTEFSKLRREAREYWNKNYDIEEKDWHYFLQKWDLRILKVEDAIHKTLETFEEYVNTYKELYKHGTQDN